MLNVSRRSFLKSVAAAAAVASVPLVSCSQKNERKPNIIYILTDDLGYGDLGCYGQKEIQTPNLDMMAEKGIRFTDHYAGSTVCAPSRCTLMTGLHTGHSIIRGNATVSLRPDELTIPKLMKKAGYTTGLAGKWGLGEPGSVGVPTQQGFDSFLGYLNQIKAHNYWPEYLWRNDEKIYLDNRVVIAESGYAKGVGGASDIMNDYSHDLFTQDVMQFVEKNAEQPFFFYLAYTIPHANNEHWVMDRHGMEIPGFDYGMYNDKDWPDAQKGHAAMITRMDRDIGNIVSKLEALGLAEDTLIIFSSDNGPHAEGLNDPDFNDSNGPVRGKKRDLTDGGIRVPMIGYWPGRIAPGQSSDHVSAFWDVLPTCAEIAGVAVEQEIDGISFLPTLLGKSEKQKKHDYLYWEFHEGGHSKQALRTEEWKALRLDPKADIELYAIKKDIGEKHNVASEHPEIVKKMQEIFASARTESEFWELTSKM